MMSLKVMESGLVSGDVLEIRGPCGSAKTEIALNMISKYSLSLELGGDEKIAVFFDLDNRFDVLRLSQLITTRILKAERFQTGNVSVPPHVQVEDIVQVSPDFPSESQTLAQKLLLDSLSRIKVICPANTAELIICLEAIRHELRNEQIFLVIDSLGSFYSRDRISVGAEGLQNALVTKLISLIHEHSIILCCIKPDLSWTRVEYMPDSWIKLVNYQITLVQDPSASDSGMDKFNMHVIGKMHSEGSRSKSVTISVTEAGIVEHCE